MGLTLFLIGMLIAVASGQTYDCQCAFFATDQLPGQIGDASPVPFKFQYFQVDPDTCNEPTAGNNTCKYVCDEWGQGAVEETGFNLCSAQASNENETGIARCAGGLFCEALYRDDRIPAEGLESSVRVYYRMPECPDGTTHQVWSLATYEYPEALCCSPVGTYDSCYDACECVKVDPARYCECGVFAQIQFQAGGEEAIPLPVRMVSSQQGDAPFSYCDNYAGGAFDEVCNIDCYNTGLSYFGNYSLLDSANVEYNVESDVTYGQLYCNGLRSRRILFDEYINTAIVTYKRAPFCFPDNTWLAASPPVIHPERLCCNEEGEHQYPCPELINSEEPANH